MTGQLWAMIARGDMGIVRLARLALVQIEPPWELFKQEGWLPPRHRQRGFGGQPSRPLDY